LLALARLQSTVRTLRGECVAVVGYGPIGQRVAQMLLAGGAQPIALARTARSQHGVEVRSLAALHSTLAAAAATVICAPLNAATRRLIDRNAFAAMRQGAMLVNVSRGAIVDTPALCDALESGRLAGAGLDVTDPEPLPPDHALRKFPGVILTPHLAYAGGGPREQQARIDLVVANATAFAAGEVPVHVAFTSPAPEAAPR
jgi:phosphoglycerate dehydrogenase-like enzyme